ncbi:alpha-N-acetylglucosaminidase [Carboxylicivirga mesophila]|uniref:Alpha-N-acetylglucosaminidase n=1 Tax=Carboxylicivirga mesophila TaxID=1166478 RepID=A0ABS5KCF1_9BACT|nr:alpha-N-acetylglucosaminidase [Carboxylicivirga mesophila]MBS2212668.1 alpha-N-acetylglucosaminidase [Carboxylicivirga mesophila]
MHFKILTVALLLLVMNGCKAKNSVEEPVEVVAKQVLSRVVGKANADVFAFKYVEGQGNDAYSINVADGKVVVTGSSPTALCRGAYDYLRNNCHSIVSWSGNHINIPETLPLVDKTVQSPFKYRYYLNTVTHGYTTPYWDWERWEKELDWMAMHGMNMPLIAGAHEAILYRVFENLGLNNNEILDYFSGPAHFPWNRMGNIGAWDGPPPASFFDKQIELNHKMLTRMKELQMEPIVHAFAGFVPKGISRLYPDEKVRELGWGGFDEKVHILSPESDLFVKIGKMYIEEWEKEFGKGKYYLADSFNEMDVPLSDDPVIANNELAAYGEVVYKPIKEANPDAVWVMQGWTFPYHRDKDGKLFWTPERLNAMMSKIPDDKLMILDMANEYNALFWKIDYSWEMYKGFFGKQWIYSFIPNMGGKVPLNGVLDFYASAPKQALQYENKGQLIGFGFAPEGIENNEVIYELLSDWGWRTDEINLDEWLEMYSKARYGAYPDKMKQSWDLLRKSCFGTFTDHPRFRYQFRPGPGGSGSVHQSDTFEQAVQLFLQCAEELGGSELYKYDAIELGAQLMGLRVDEKLHSAGTLKKEKRYAAYEEAIADMLFIDRLLASHPNHKLQNWVDLARGFGSTTAEKQYYESNAKRLNTTWGGGVNEYAARTWNGLIGSYYAKRWELWLEAEKENRKFNVLEWEEQWIQSEYENETIPFDNPIQELLRSLSE